MAHIVTLDFAHHSSSQKSAVSGVISSNPELLMVKSCQASDNSRNSPHQKSECKNSSNSASDPQTLPISGKSSVKNPHASKAPKNKLLRKSLKPTLGELLEFLTKSRRTRKKKLQQNNKTNKKRKRWSRNIRKESPCRHVEALPMPSDPLSLSHNTPCNRAVASSNTAAATDVFSDDFTLPNGDNLDIAVGSLRSDLCNNHLYLDSFVDESNQCLQDHGRCTDDGSQRNQKVLQDALRLQASPIAPSKPLWLFAFVLNLSLILLNIPFIPGLLSSSTQKLNYIFYFNSVYKVKVHPLLSRWRRRRFFKVDDRAEQSVCSTTSCCQEMTFRGFDASCGAVTAFNSIDEVNNPLFDPSRYPRTSFLWWRDAYSWYGPIEMSLNTNFYLKSVKTDRVTRTDWLTRAIIRDSAFNNLPDNELSRVAAKAPVLKSSYTDSRSSSAEARPIIGSVAGANTYVERIMWSWDRRISLTITLSVVFVLVIINILNITI